MRTPSKVNLSLPMLILPIAVLAAAASPSWGDDAAKSRRLISLVGSDAGLCIELRDYSEHRQRFVNSEFFRRLSASPLTAKLLDSADVRRLKEAQARLEKLAGKPFHELFADVAGRSVVLAAYPQDSGEPAGVFLAQTADAVALQSVVRVWNEADPQSVNTSLKHRGAEYFRRDRRSRSNRPLYFATLNDVLAVSDREDMIRKVIDLQKAGAPEPGQRTATTNATRSLAESANYRAAMKSLRGRPLAVAYVNPRRWDRMFVAAATPESGNEKLAPGARIWKSILWIAAAVRVENGIVGDTVVEFDRDKLPAALNDSAGRVAGSSTFLDRIPADALIAVAGRFDPVGVEQVMKAAPDLGKVQGIGRALLGVAPAEVLGKLRESYGFFVIAGKGSQEDGDGAFLPFEALAAVELADDPEAAWRDRLETGLANATQFLATSYNIQVADRPNAKQLVLKSDRRKNLTIRWVESLQGYRPAVAVARRFLIVASRPELAAAFDERATDELLVSLPSFQQWKKEYFPTHNQLAYVNVQLVREHLKGNAAAVLAPWTSTEEAQRERSEKMESRFADAIAALELVDALFLASDLRESRVRLTFGCVAAATTDQESSDDSPTSSANRDANR